MAMRRATLLLSLAAMAWLGLHAPASRAATAEEQARVERRLREAAAPWCERLSERDAAGRKRCTIKLTAQSADLPQAFAFMGDANITQAMLERLSEPELALVGGHEFAHLVLGHVLVGARLGRLPGSLVQMLESINVPPHDDTPEDRPQLELDADRLGLFFAGLAGYPVRQLAADWHTVLARLPVQPQTGTPTHPPADLRAAKLLEAADEFCTLGQRRELLIPALEHLQPRYESDLDDLREQQAQLPIHTICRLPASP